MSAPDVIVIVIGAGIVATAAAAFLAAGGAHVTLYERAGLASGASGANSGVVEHPFDPAHVALASRPSISTVRCPKRSRASVCPTRRPVSSSSRANRPPFNG